jgi:tetratricopeptide (TPR) repeat protein
LALLISHLINHLGRLYQRFNLADLRQASRLESGPLENPRVDREAVTPEVQATSHVQQALIFHQKGRLDEAKRLYESALAGDPGNFDALHLLGVLRHQQGFSAEALRLVVAALDTRPGSAEALANCGVILDALKHHAAALAAFEQVLEMRPADATAHYNRGLALNNLGRRLEALGSFEKALNSAPDHVDSRYQHGNTLCALGRHQQALADYQMVLAIRPQYLPALNRCGNALVAMKRWADALTMYNAILAIAPTDAEALSNRSVALLQLGQCREAIESCDRALAARPQYADALYNRGNALFALRRFEDACSSYELTLECAGTHVDALNNLGLALSELGHQGEALSKYDKVLELDPNHVGALQNWANALIDLKRFEEALAICDKAPANADRPEVHNTRGVALGRVGRHDESLASYDRAIALMPDFVEAQCNRGSALHALKRHEEALTCYDQALALQPGYAAAHSNRGNTLKELGRLDEALASYNRALTLQPELPEAHCNRGNVLHELKRHEEALASYERALTLEPEFAVVYANRGNALNELRRFNEAITSYQRALELRPDFANAHYGLALCCLLIGDFTQGWREHEWRWETPDLKIAKRDFMRPLWLGDEEITGKTIMLHAEQGFGDTLQFCRYVPLVCELGAQVILEVPAPVADLMRSLSGKLQIVAQGDLLPDFDLHCPLMSLPVAFETRLENIPGQVPYLSAPENKQSRWRDRVGQHDKVRIGLAWAGAPRKHQPTANRGDRYRSINFDQIAALLDIQGCEFYSLQKGDDAVAQLRNSTFRDRVIDWTDDFEDFGDTAALVENLDLVIAVDCSIAHLAGALGKPVWLLNRYDTCWRWLLDREDTPWYPSARLFRQDATRVWDGVIARIRIELNDYLQKHECWR